MSSCESGPPQGCVWLRLIAARHVLLRGSRLTVLYLGIFAGSLLLSFVLTRCVRNFAVSQGLVFAPRLERHVHTEPLPRLGGVAIFLSFLLSIGFVELLSLRYPHLRTEFPVHALLPIIVPGALVFALGVYDDFRGVGPAVKFGVQAVAGAMLFFGGLRIMNIPVISGGQQFPWFIGLPLTILWVIAITNAFNLLDGLDGLAAGSALFSILVVFVVSLGSQASLVSLMSVALAGATLGFLRYNFNPATIFLGDSGSLFLGFMLSALALRGTQKSPTIIAVAIPVVSFGLPILETGLSIIRRLISGRPVLTGDREHIHHKLLQLGMSQRQAVIVLYAVSAVFALLSLLLLWPGSALGLVLAVVGVGIWLGVQHLNYLEFGELRRVAHRTIEQRQIFVKNIAIRRALEELKVAHDAAQLGRVLKAAFENGEFYAFELHLPLHQLSKMQRDSSYDTSCFRWKKPGMRFEREAGSTWSIHLELVSSNHRRQGTLTLHHERSERDLQFDINLLTSTLPKVLADAIDRICRQEVEMMPRTQSEPSFAAAASAV